MKYFSFVFRANGKSFVCDVNGFSFVKNSNKYYDDCAKILGNMILRELTPTLHIPWSVPFQLDGKKRWLIYCDNPIEIEWTLRHLLLQFIWNVCRNSIINLFIACRSPNRSHNIRQNDGIEMRRCGYSSRWSYTKTKNEGWGQTSKVSWIYCNIVVIKNVIDLENDSEQIELHSSS